MKIFILRVVCKCHTLDCTSMPPTSWSKRQRVLSKCRIVPPPPKNRFWTRHCDAERSGFMRDTGLERFSDDNSGRGILRSTSILDSLNSGQSNSANRNGSLYDCDSRMAEPLSAQKGRKANYSNMKVVLLDGVDPLYHGRVIRAKKSEDLMPKA